MRRTAAAITSRIWFQGPRVSREPAKVDSRRLATSAFDGFSGSLLPARKSQSGSGTRKGDPLKDARLSSGDAVDSIQVPNLPRFLTRTGRPGKCGPNATCAAKRDLTTLCAL